MVEVSPKAVEETVSDSDLTASSKSFCACSFGARVKRYVYALMMMLLASFFARLSFFYYVYPTSGVRSE